MFELLGGFVMKLKKLNVRLTEKDKLILSKYIDICTDLHGSNCNIKNWGIKAESKE